MKPACNTNSLVFYLYLSKIKILGFALFIFLGLFLFPRIAHMSGITEEKIIEETNRIRANKGLGTLTANQYLTKAAYDKADAIIDSQTFAHDIGGRRFSSWIKDTGYSYLVVGENLAINFLTSEGVINAWLDSPLHKKNLVNSEFQEIGVAVKNAFFKGRESIIVVQIFGKPLSKGEIAPDEKLFAYNLSDSFLADNENNLSRSLSKRFSADPSFPYSSLSSLNMPDSDEIIFERITSERDRDYLLALQLFSIYLFLFSYSFYFSELHRHPAHTA